MQICVYFQLAVVVENFKSEFENVKLNAPGPEDNSALETKPSEDPTTQYVM